MILVGFGYDIHRLVSGRKLIIGGVEIPHSKGLDGHSDADVLIHAICDSIFGALGLGDIGAFFPNTEKKWKDISSIVFLKEAYNQVSIKNARLVNIDCTIIAQQPKLLPYIPSMKKIIAETLQIKTENVGIKATTNEGIGCIGREEGIAAFAVASVELVD